MSVGSNIKRFREKQGLTQLELAEAAGISRSMVAQIERDSRCPTLILSKQIAEVLKVDIEELL